jgi:hypothetical protein
MMPIRAQFVVTLLALVCTGAASAESLPDHCAILPTSEGPALIHQRSRGSPTNVSGFWTPSPEQVLSIEKLLPDLLRKNHLKSKISDSYRQYVGIISSGRKLIYLNSIPHELPDWRTKAVVVFDGGEAFWGVEFDPADNTFHNLGSNGWA